MFVLGMIIAIFEIVAGIITLVISQGQWAVVVVGISYILSGLLFMWLVKGSRLARLNEERIDELEEQVQALRVERDRLKVTVNMLEEKVNNIPQSKENK